MTRKDVDTIGSPVFHPTISDIPDGGFETVDLNKANSQYAKYLPYDFIEITNMSAAFLTLTLNDVHEFALPGNISTQKSDIKFNRFTVTNNSGGALTGTDIFVSVQHTPLTEDKLVRRPKTLSDKIISAVPFLGLMR